jgi:hypothetical protein
MLYSFVRFRHDLTKQLLQIPVIDSQNSFLKPLCFFIACNAFLFFVFFPMKYELFINQRSMAQEYFRISQIPMENYLRKPFIFQQYSGQKWIGNIEDDFQLSWLNLYR